MWKGRRYEDKPGQTGHILLLSSGNVPVCPRASPKFSMQGNSGSRPSEFVPSQELSNMISTTRLLRSRDPRNYTTPSDPESIFRSPEDEKTWHQEGRARWCSQCRELDPPALIVFWIVNLDLANVRAKLSRSEEHVQAAQRECRAWMDRHPYSLTKQVNDNNTRYSIILGRTNLHRSCVGH
jgi:hypothetical protein